MKGLFDMMEEAKTLFFFTHTDPFEWQRYIASLASETVVHFYSNPNCFARAAEVRQNLLLPPVTPPILNPPLSASQATPSKAKGRKVACVLSKSPSEKQAFERRMIQYKSSLARQAD